MKISQIIIQKYFLKFTSCSYLFYCLCPLKVQACCPGHIAHENFTNYYAKVFLKIYFVFVFILLLVSI